MSPRVLIVRFSAIGDCVMAAAAASCVRNSYPESFLVWAVDSRCAPVVDTSRLADLRYEIPRQQWKAGKVSWFQQYRHFARLRRFDFDYGFDLQGHSKTALCLRIANPKKKVAWRATDVAARLLNKPISSRQLPKHAVARNIYTLNTIGDFPGDATPLMPPLCPLPKEVESIVRGRLATISISAGHPKKCYSAESWRVVAEELLRRGYEVAFLGGSEDRALSQPLGHDWIGKLSLEQTMAVVARSRVHLAADTGTGHMAAAYGVPVVSVFGFTDLEEFRPFTENGIVLQAGRAMNGVSPSEVVESAEMLMASQRSAFLN